MFNSKRLEHIQATLDTLVDRIDSFIEGAREERLRKQLPKPKLMPRKPIRKPMRKKKKLGSIRYWDDGTYAYMMAANRNEKKVPVHVLADININRWMVGVKPKDIARRCIGLREAQDLTVKQFAMTDAGLSESCIHKLEQGVRIHHISTYALLADFYKVNLKYILYGGEECK